MKLPVISSKTTIIVLFSTLATLLVASIAISVYFFYKYENTKKSLSNPSEITREETRTLVAEVGKLIELPTGEEPTLATVSDAEKLGSQPFFARARDGDKVLFYTLAKKAILYRPSTQKIIEVAPISLNQSATAGGEAIVPVSKNFTVLLLNGTPTVGLTKTYEKELLKIYPDATVVDRDNAKKRDYAKSLLVDISGTKGEMLVEIAKSLNLETSKLPEGESMSGGNSADFLIIVGADAVK